MLEFSLIKLQALRTATLLKRDFNTGFSCEFCKIFKNTLFYRTSPEAASDRFRCPACNFFEKKGPGKDILLWFLQNFQEHLLTEHLRMTASYVYLWILSSFSEHFFYRAALGNWLFHVQVSEFQPPDTVKNYFISASQAFFKRTRSRHSKAFIYLKIPEIYLWRS